LIYVPQLSVGGTEKHVYGLVRSLKNEFKVTLWVKYSGGYWQKKLEALGVNIISSYGHTGIKGFLTDISNLSKLGNINIFHTFGYGPHWFDVLLVKILKSPFIIKSSRNARHWDSVGRISILERLRNRYVDLHLVNSFTVSKVLQNIEGIDENKIVNIPNFIESVDVKHMVRNSNNDNEKYSILMIANFKSVKNNLEALKVLKILVKNNDTYELIMVGDGPEKNLCVEWSERNNLSKYVQFVSANPEESVAYIIRSDIYLSTSLSEGASNSLMEAASYGKPFVSTNTGNAADLQKSGIRGSIYKAGHVDAAAEHIRKFQSLNVLEKNNIQKNNFSIMSDLFSYERVINRYIELYNNESE
jgi:L-malate glycosyltransferase